MHFNARIAGITGIITAIVYMIAPDVYESRFDTVCCMAAFYLLVWMTISFIIDLLIEIQEKRDSLQIVSKRPTRGNRDLLVTDIRMPKKSWRIEIPAEKVE